jgi:CHASE1-domain containing sensor protein
VPIFLNYFEIGGNCSMRALGYDVYSEETRRQAIDHAIKTGDTTLTGKIILVQETAKWLFDDFTSLQIF